MPERFTSSGRSWSFGDCTRNTSRYGASRRRREPGFDERFGLLVDAEYLSRENKRMKLRLRDAKLKLGQACVEDIDDPPQRGLDKATIRQREMRTTCAESKTDTRCGRP